MTKKSLQSLPGKPILLIFREVLPGDIKKQRAQSNIIKSGGGARDLRFGNAKSWIPFLPRMFASPTSKTGVYQEPIHWIESDGTIKSSSASCWRPTKARPDELRIGMIHHIEGWKIDERNFIEAKAKGKRWFYGLYLDDEDRLWARLIKEEALGIEPKIIQGYIQKRIKETRASATVFGAINLLDSHQTLESHISNEQVRLLNRVTSQKRPSAEALEAVDEVTRGRELENIIDEWVERNEGKKPEEIKRQVKLFKRCYSLVGHLKEKHGYKCQIETCRFTFRMKNGRYYCEAAHIKPLKGREAGLDSPKNILILCPNHHKMLDYGAMKIISFSEVEIEGKKMGIVS